MSKPHYRRRKRLIKPRLQWKLIGSFVGILVLGMLLQYLLLARELAAVAEKLPSDGSALVAEVPGMLAVVLAGSFGVLLPLTIVVGVLLTFRIAGPVYRFEQHLGAIARGEDPGTCRLRKGDDLTELCEIINDAVERLRAEPGEGEREAPPLRRAG